MRKKRNKGTKKTVTLTLNLPADLAVQLEEELPAQNPALGYEEYLAQRVTDALGRFEQDFDLSLIHQATALMAHKKMFQKIQKDAHTLWDGKMTQIDGSFTLEKTRLKETLDEIHGLFSAVINQDPAVLTTTHDEATQGVNACLGCGARNSQVSDQARALAVVLVALNAVGEPNFK
jgi:hypothetical protein